MKKEDKKQQNVKENVEKYSRLSHFRLQELGGYNCDHVQFNAVIGGDNETVAQLNVVDGYVNGNSHHVATKESMENTHRKRHPLEVHHFAVTDLRRKSSEAADFPKVSTSFGPRPPYQK